MDVRTFGSWMSAPECLSFFRILRALTELWGRDIRANDPRMSVGYSPPKLPLLAELSLLNKAKLDQQDQQCVNYPVLLFLGLFENTKENLQNTKDFSPRANPQKPCKTSRKHSKRPRKFPGRKTPRKRKHQGKEGQGRGIVKISGFLQGVFVKIGDFY